MKVLIVTNPFAGHGVGHVISDPAEMEAVLAGEHAGHAVAAEYDGSPEPLDEGLARPARGRNKPTQE